MDIQNVVIENRYNEKCRQAIEMLKVFMADAKLQMKSDIPLSTLELIIGTIGEQPKEPESTTTAFIGWDNAPEEIAYRG